MTGLAEVVRQHGQHYIAQHHGRLLPSHVRALRAIASCRTPALGRHLAHCSRCDSEHLLYHSCRHRACPQCGHDATQRWLAQQRELILPVPYFHVVFTLPAELRRVVRAHQRTLLPVLFRTAFDSLAALSADPKFVGGQIGALAVLHTWTRTLEWHPHLRVLVPGGALASDGRTWLPLKTRKKRFLVPVKALAQRFRARFVHLARRCLPSGQLPHVPWSKAWVVFAKPAVQGADTVLAYLGRYVHRTAIADKAIAACRDGRVTFTYRDSRDHTRKRMTLPAHEFLRRFLQHVPAKGLHRVRAYGLLHPVPRTILKRLQWLLGAAAAPRPEHKPPHRGKRCPRCHQEALVLLRRLAPGQCVAWNARHLLASATARAPPSSRSASLLTTPSTPT